MQNYKNTLQAVLKSKWIILRAEQKKKSGSIAEFIEGEIAGLEIALDILNDMEA